MFSRPHKCPGPVYRITSAVNYTMRTSRKTLGYQSKVLDYRYIHSKFCPVQTIRLPTDDGFFTCARFLPGNQSLIVGDYSGEVKIFNIQSGAEETSVSCHDSYIVHIEPSKDGNLILTSSTWGRPLSSLWRNSFVSLVSFQEEEHVEFSKLSDDKIIGMYLKKLSIFLLRNLFFCLIEIFNVWNCIVFKCNFYYVYKVRFKNVTAFPPRR